MTRNLLLLAAAVLIAASPVMAAESHYEFAVPVGSHDAAAFYPDEARRLDEQGDVVVSFTIGVDGAVSGATVQRSSGYPALDAAALAAVATWRYKPATSDGKPVAVPHHAVLRFNLFEADSIFGVANPDADDCTGFTHKKADQRIAACTTVLAMPTLMEADRVVALRERGGAYIDARRVGDALTDINAALAIAPDDYRAVIARGDAYFALTQYPRATAEYDRAIALQPDNGFAYYSRGVAHARSDQFDLARKDLDDALRLIPGWPGALSLRADIAVRQGRYDVALVDANESLTHLPNFIPALFSRSAAYSGLHRDALAVADDDKVVELLPAESYAYSHRCMTRAQWGQGLDLALADCNKALELDAQNSESMDTRALVYFRMARFAQAIADCDAVMAKVGRSADRLYIRGLAKRKTGDAAGGKTDIDTATLLNPKIVSVYAGFGVTQ